MKFLLLAVLFAFAGALTAGETVVPDISQADLAKAIADKQVTLIDVNGTDSWKAGHIPGAIDFEAKGKDLATLLPADKNALVVAYCGGPACNAYKNGAKAAQELGYTNVKHFKEGISGWKASGAAVESGDAAH